MPYLHWERVLHYKQMRNEVQMLEKTTSTFPVDAASLETQLLRKYLPEYCLQIRRSLDQSYYSTIGDTTERDEEQVVDRYARTQLGEEDEAKRPLLMVDQLWLWVLDESTPKQ